MNVTRTLKKITVAMSTVGLLAPSAIIQAAEPISTKASVQTAELLSDVRLDGRGVLNGQVVMANGVAKVGTRVSVRQEVREVNQTVTDGQGRFEIHGLKAGVYSISTTDGTKLYRVWGHQAAPPAATEGILFVNDGQVSRGQIASQWGLGAVILGGLAGIIVAVSVDHNSAS